VNASARTYQTQQVMTASPAKLVAMLYDKAILSLREAIHAIEKGDIQTRFNANKRAGDIITHLWTTLDTERGGEIAANLSRLYSFMLGRLTFVDVRNDPEPAREVITLLEPLRDSWTQLAHGATAAAPSPAKGAAVAGGFSVSA
jgi:flagellar protein FliS